MHSTITRRDLSLPIRRSRFWPDTSRARASTRNRAALRVEQRARTSRETPLERARRETSRWRVSTSGGERRRASASVGECRRASASGSCEAWRAPMTLISSGVSIPARRSASRCSGSCASSSSPPPLPSVTTTIDDTRAAHIRDTTRQSWSSATRVDDCCDTNRRAKWPQEKLHRRSCTNSHQATNQVNNKKATQSERQKTRRGATSKISATSRSSLARGLTRAASARSVAALGAQQAAASDDLNWEPRARASRVEPNRTETSRFEARRDETNTRGQCRSLTIA